MPAITGIISKGYSKENHKQLELMMDVMFHEKFYKSGIYENEEMGIYLGWLPVSRPPGMTDAYRTFKW